MLEPIQGRAIVVRELLKTGNRRKLRKKLRETFLAMNFIFYLEIHYLKPGIMVYWEIISKYHTNQIEYVYVI